MKSLGQENTPNQLKSDKQYPTVFPIIGLLLLFFSLDSCSDNESILIDVESQKIINATPLLHMSTEGDSDYFSPPEALAIQFLNLLEKVGLQKDVRACAAADEYRANGGKSKKCINYDIDMNDECLIREGFGKGYLHKQLVAKKMDLNNDNISDYIVSGNTCTGFSHNYTSDFFVFLSQKDATYNLALTVSASFISVVPKANGKGYLVIDGVNSYNGDSVNIWNLEGSRFKKTACFYQSHTEKIQAYRSAECN